MVTQGEMSPFREFEFPLTIQDTFDVLHEIGVVLDTGFDGYLSLPLELIQALRLTFDRSQIVFLADGVSRELATYKANIIWNGQDRYVDVYATEGVPLIGIALIYGMIGTFHFSDGGVGVMFRP